MVVVHLNFQFQCTYLVIQVYGSISKSRDSHIIFNHLKVEVNIIYVGISTLPCDAKAKLHQTPTD